MSSLPFFGFILAKTLAVAFCKENPRSTYRFRPQKRRDPQKHGTLGASRSHPAWRLGSSLTLGARNPASSARIARNPVVAVQIGGGAMRFSVSLGTAFGIYEPKVNFRSTVLR